MAVSTPNGERWKKIELEEEILIIFYNLVLTEIAPPDLLFVAIAVVLLTQKALTGIVVLTPSSCHLLSPQKNRF
jgi:hypothetical protein